MLSYIFPGCAPPAFEALFSGGTPRVVHVTAVYDCGSGGPLHTLLMLNEHSPRCLYDFFVLNAVRALADSVLVTGMILREEPMYHCDVQGPFAAALKRWRTEVLGKARPASSVVLTRGAPGAIDFRHVLFRTPVMPPSLPDAADTHTVTVLTSSAATVSRLESELAQYASSQFRMQDVIAQTSHPELYGCVGRCDTCVVCVPNLTVHAALSHMHASATASSASPIVSIEAGMPLHCRACCLDAVPGSLELVDRCHDMRTE